MSKLDYYPGMREHTPDVCWLLLGKEVCIRDRGHNNGIHEAGGPVTLSREDAERVLALLETGMWRAVPVGCDRQAAIKSLEAALA